MGFNMAFRGLIINMHYTEWNPTSAVNLQWTLHKKLCSGGG